MCIFSCSQQHMCWWWSVWKWNNVRKRAAEVGEERERYWETVGGENTRNRVWRLCNKLQQEELLRRQGRRRKTLVGIRKRSGMGRCQTEQGRESEWGGGEGGGGDCVVRTSETVHGEASEWALRSRQRGVEETWSKVTPVIDMLVSGEKPGIFLPLWGISTIF